MVEFQVEGMSCSHCVNAVTRSVHAVDGDAKVEVDLGAQRVRVESTADVEKIAGAIVDAGYPVLSRTVTSSDS